MEENYNEPKEENMARRRKNNKRIYIIVILVLLLVAAGVSFAVWNSYFRDNQTQEESSDESDDKGKADAEKDSKSNEDAKKEVSGNDDNVEPEREKEKEELLNYEGSNPNSAEGLTGVVTYAGSNGDALVIRMNIDQYITSGSCELGLYKNGVIVYSDTANISAAASTATCEGFNVPVSSMGGGGKYQIVINVKSGDKAGVINGEVEI